MILYDNEAREYLKKGIDLLANAVKVTLGPCGCNVVIDNQGVPRVTKDGVTVAKSILVDEYKTGINMIKSVSEKMGNTVGDYTTSSTVLTQKIIDIIFNEIKKDSNLRPIYIKRGIDMAVKDILKQLNKKTYVTSNDDIYNVVMISSNQDVEISEIVSDVINKVGTNGLISIKPGESKTSVKFSQGLKWNTKYLNPNFVTDPVKMEVEYENCHILIYDNKLDKLQNIVKELDWCKQREIPVVIAVKDIEHDVLNTLAYNNLSGKLKCCVVKIPGFNEYREDNILDLKAVIGNSILVDKVVITRDSMYVSNSKNNIESKQNRINLLKHRLTLNDPNIEDLTNRIANIDNSFATIYVSGNSEIEIQEKIDRYDDSICAAKAALEEGIIPGGGNILYQLSKTMPLKETGDKSIMIGYNSMIKSLSITREQILKNGNQYIESDKHIIFKNNEFIEVNNALKHNILDAKKSVRLGIENAASIAGAVITTNCVII